MLRRRRRIPALGLRNLHGCEELVVIYELRFLVCWRRSGWLCGGGRHCVVGFVRVGCLVKKKKNVDQVATQGHAGVL